MPQDILPNSASEPSTTTQKGIQAATEEDDLVYKRILVPIDFSEHSKKTVSYATRFASRYNATVQLLHVFEIPDYAATPYGWREQTCNQIKSQVDAAEQDARENLTAFENQLLNGGVKVEAYFARRISVWRDCPDGKPLRCRPDYYRFSRLHRDHTFARWQHC